MSLNILHLSDIHICNNNAPSAASLLSDNDFQRGAPDVILVTGDLFDHAAFDDCAQIQTNIARAINFFDELIEAINITYASLLNRESVLFVPGNHEVSRNSSGISNKLSNYKQFLFEYFNGTIPAWYDETDLSFVRLFSKECVVIVGFCSPSCEDPIAGEKYDDYGLISSRQLLNVKNRLKRIENKNAYTYVAALHHQFLLMEERNKKYIEKNYLRNPDQFVNHLATFNYSAVLHGHKHLKANRRINIESDISKPEKMITVLGCGSLSDDVIDNSFNYITVYPVGSKYEIEYSAFARKNAGYIADGQQIKLPIRSRTLITFPIEEIIGEHPDLALAYRNLCNYDTITHSTDIFRLFDNTLFSLPTAVEQIKNIPDILYFVLAMSHFRFSLRASHNNSVQKKINEFIEPIVLKHFGEKISIYELMQIKDINEIFEKYQKEVKKLNGIPKKILTFSTIAILLTEFFLTIKSESQEFYKRIVSKKVDFTYTPENLEADLQGNSIVFSVDDERRSLEVSITCDTAAAIKVCSLIIKEFEIILHNYERDFSECGFRVYYVSPKLKNKGIAKSDIDSRQFTAYIPKLLPLLAGKNIYSDVEAFAREVIQNSIDAINARKEFDASFTEEGKITITISTNGELQYFEIFDNGSGMTRYILERYLTTLGLSYYSGVEYNSQNPNYDPISQFGIGFLSCFMLGKHIEVRTCHYEAKQGLFLDIPNYDGCFFIEDDNNSTVGTTIRIWENPDLATEGGTIFNPERIIEFISKHILNVNIDITINGELVIPNRQYLKSIERHTRHFNVLHYVPLIKNSSTGIWEATADEGFSPHTNYGVVIYKNDEDIYVNSNYAALLNNGILIPDIKTVNILGLGQEYFSVCANFPPETMELDVSRDKLIRLNSKISFESLYLVMSVLKRKYMNKNAPYYLLQQQYGFESCADGNLCFLFDKTQNTLKIMINDKKVDEAFFKNRADNFRLFLNFLTENSFQQCGSYMPIPNESDLSQLGISTVMAYNDMFYALSSMKNEYSKHHSVSSTQAKYNNIFVSSLFNSEGYKEGQFSPVLSAKEKLIKCIPLKSNNDTNKIIAAMNSQKKQFDKLRSSNKAAITNMFKDKRYTAPNQGSEAKSYSLMKIAMNKKSVPVNLNNFLSILIRHAYTSGTKNNGQIYLSDIAAFSWQAITTLLDYASIICSYEMLENGIEIALDRKDFVPYEDWFPKN